MSSPPSIDLGRIVHDLRGPLMPLRTSAWLMRSELGDSPRVRELADIVDRQTDKLLRLMDEFGEWARFDSAAVPVNCVPVESAQLVDMALCGIPDCRVAPVYHDASAAVQVLADKHRADQMLRSLIQYAMHRGGDRAPTLEVSIQAERLVIRVRDHGPPLAAEARQSLLTSPQHAPFDDGLGLRLIIARKIAEAHGWRLDLDERVTDGVALICSLPALD